MWSFILQGFTPFGTLAIYSKVLWPFLSVSLSSFVSLILAVGLSCRRLRTPPPLPGGHTSVSGSSAIASCHDNSQLSFPAVSEKVNCVRINWPDGLSLLLTNVTDTPLHSL